MEIAYDYFTNLAKIGEGLHFRLVRINASFLESFAPHYRRVLSEAHAFIVQTNWQNNKIQRNRQVSLPDPVFDVDQQRFVRSQNSTVATNWRVSSMFLTFLLGL
jgi:hypothetical protein